MCIYIHTALKAWENLPTVGYSLASEILEETLFLFAAVPATVFYRSWNGVKAKALTLPGGAGA